MHSVCWLVFVVRSGRNDIWIWIILRWLHKAFCSAATENKQEMLFPIPIIVRTHSKWNFICVLFYFQAKTQYIFHLWFSQSNPVFIRNMRLLEQKGSKHLEFLNTNCLENFRCNFIFPTNRVRSYKLQVLLNNIFTLSSGIWYCQRKKFDKHKELLTLNILTFVHFEEVYVLPPSSHLFSSFMLKHIRSIHPS